MRWISWVMAASMCGVGPVASAWTPGDMTSREVPGVPSTVQVVQIDGEAVLAGTGAAGTWLVDPASGAVRARSERPGSDLLLVDLDADGSTDVLVCAPDGVWRLDASLGAEQRLTTEACLALETYTQDGEIALVTANQALGLWTWRGGALQGPRRFGLALGGPPLLASDGERFTAVGRGDLEIVERSGFGRSTIAAGGPVVGLATGDDGLWSWAVAEPPALDDSAHRKVPLAPDPIGLVAADLDGDGSLERIVSHPGAIGVVAGGASDEVLYPVPLVPVAIAVGDLDGDGCGDVVLAQADLAVVGMLRGRCAATAGEPSAEAADPHPEPSSQPTTLVLDDSSPTVHARVGETLLLQLADPRGQASFAARGGPSGLSVSDDGLVEFTPQPEHLGSWRVTVRMWHGIDLVRTRAFWLDVHPFDEPLVRQEVEPEEPAPVGSFERSAWSIRSCNASFGVAGSASSPQRSWEFIGQGAVPRASPAVAVTCEGGWDRARWFGGWDSAPMIEYVMDPYTKGSHFLGMTVGAVFGDDRLRVGPYATIGATLMGLGGRAVWMPFGDQNPSGLEARVTLFVPSGPAGELLLLYTWQFGSYE